MEGIRVEEIDFTDHEKKCRVCFKLFGHDEHRVNISKLIERKFREVTQTELKISAKFSSEICVICNYQLSNFWQFKNNVLKTQKRLYKFQKCTEQTKVICLSKGFGETELEQQKNLTEDFIDSSKFVTDVKEELETESESDIFKEGDEAREHFVGIEIHEANRERRRLSGKTGEHTCPHCEVRIVERSQLKRHIERVHLKVKNFKCDQCNYQCYFKYSLDSHMKSHIDRNHRRSFSCNTCDYVTVSKDSLRVHQAVHRPKTQNQIYECSTCFEVYETYNQLYRHKLKLHSEVEKYVCHVCNKPLKGAAALKNHMVLFHETSKLTFKCPIVGCSKTCVTTKQLQNHLKTHNEDSKEICSICGLLVANKHNLDKHINRVHLKLRNFGCDLCEYKGFFKFNIVEHMKKHLDKSERERFSCDEPRCKFQSVSKTSLRAHKRLEHLGQKRSYTCHCGKTFSQNSSFYTHIKIVHEKFKKHSCKLCTKAFFEKAQLKNHVKSQHLKQKDLPCQVCGKLFATKKHLQSHLKYHDNPHFICSFENCSNNFYTLSQLKSHIKVHKNIRDHKCNLCEKSYYHKSHLKKHELTHGIV